MAYFFVGREIGPGYGRGTGARNEIPSDSVCASRYGADDGNRTRVFSLGS
jgi:hypothetical protein